MDEESCLIESPSNSLRLVNCDRVNYENNDCRKSPQSLRVTENNDKTNRRSTGEEQELVTKNNDEESGNTKTEIPAAIIDKAEEISSEDVRLHDQQSQKEGQKQTDRMVEEGGKETDRMRERGGGGRRNRKMYIGGAGTKTIPPDGGWGWVVLAGSFVVMLLISSIGPCFSLVFSPILLDLGTPPTTIFWIFGTFSLVWNFVSPAVGPLTKEFGHRRVAMVGSILVTSGLIVSAFATSSWILFVFFSFMGGIGAGILVTISNLIIPVYFTKRLGRANGILMTGTSIGLFTAPHLINFLQDHYTYLGATLILGGIFLNTCLSAAVFHPVAWHSKTVVCQGGSCAPRKDYQLPLCKSDSVNSCGVDEKLVGGSGATASRMSLPKEKKRKCVGIFALLGRVSLSTILSLRILCTPTAFIIALSGTLTMNSYLNFLIMVPFVVKNLHSAQASALCLSVAGICNLVSRLIMSAMTDCQCFDKRIGYIISISIIAVTNLAFPFVTSVLWMTVTMAFWGYGVGSFMGLYNLVMIQYMGAMNMPAMFGSASLLNGIGFISIGPLLGFVTEITGSYSISIWALASIECFCIILWLLMPAAVAWQARNLTPSPIAIV